MPSIALKRINKEIQNYNEKAYLTNNVNFLKPLLSYLAGLTLEVSTINISNKDEYFLLVKDTNNKQILQLKYPEYYPISEQ